ncbi:transglycosylase-like protein with SLT domain [Pseudonocardia sediminis]|uniref:Transglycosylase-like protein with SLT domain n=1 Tax=Pseudonocardia sediminis TaxID=1397368 RepID=A0A4Q7V1I5_PSEST|nr:transglycosylase family protein [Pseudonocardia sediminis]RZT87181.1 transglycosylase-like protein with SLT domain [Pseudonocardia sediminis]
MAGRHRKPTNTGRRVARAGALTAIAAAPLGVAGTAMAAPSAPAAPSVEKTSTWDKLAHCESTGNWDADTGNGFKGGLQFTPSTWKEFGGKEHAPSADQATRAEQIEVAKKVQDQQGWKAWPACTKKLGWR